MDNPTKKKKNKKKKKTDTRGRGREEGREGGAEKKEDVLLTLCARFAKRKKTISGFLL